MIEPTALNRESFTNPDDIVIELYYRNSSIIITPAQTPFQLGRDNVDSGLAISCEFASRQHCAIEFQGGKFMLNDFSRNGTFVQLNRAQTFRVLNETAPLIGSGCFKLGAEIAIEDPDRILFRIKAASEVVSNPVALRRRRRR
ncbi:MAG: FHA domain-containing protein [Pseudomonadota bacterium]